MYRLLYILTLTPLAAFCNCADRQNSKGSPSPATDAVVVVDDTEAFVPVKGIAVLDLTARNGEVEHSAEGRNLYSAEYMLEVAGTPGFTTTSLTEAIHGAQLMLCSSPIHATTFSDAELDSLTQWVSDGGTIIAPAILDPTNKMTALFGISTSTMGRKRHSFTWNETRLKDKVLEYMDEEEERTVVMATQSKDNAIRTYGYTLTTAQSLATFDSGETAVALNRIGKGKVYSFGIQWRDVIQRLLLNKDNDAQRYYSNGFEVSRDAYPLFLRSAYADCQDVSVWKNTIPDGYQSVLIPTHDCDSRTAYDSMQYMSDYEKQLGLSAHFFLTVHYYRDPGYLSAFYDDDAVAKARLLLENGHTVGSHSIGHFPDFDKTDRFPITVTTREKYAATHNVKTGVTTGGSTWAEVALSKQIIEKDLGNQVRSFRTGHLAMNNNIPEVQAEAGYEFSSCYGAGDLMGAFPFFERMRNSWEGSLSPVLQMPLHFSDVGGEEKISATNWSARADQWLVLLNKLKGNFAPSILLIHPNREWKMWAEKRLVEIMDRSAVGLYNFEAYGDFWVNRSATDFQYAYRAEQDQVIIRVSSSDLQRSPHVCFVVETTSGHRPSEVVLRDERGTTYPLQTRELSTTKYIYYY